MAIYEVSPDEIKKVNETSFSQAGIKERDHLQKLLREKIEIVSPDTLIIAEEFGEWQDSNRRIDLLGLDKQANLVVIELKRTQDGGHMELQAIRYAAMVSAMTFEKAVEVYGSYLEKKGNKDDPEKEILNFLEWDEPVEGQFAQDVRIVLVSADFSKELTTSVIWLNNRNLDIRCVRMKPYQYQNKTLIDVQEIIPLPEARDYQNQIKEKEQKGRSSNNPERLILRKRFWTQLLNIAKSKTSLHLNISPSTNGYIFSGSGIRGLSFAYIIRKKDGSVDLYIDRGKEEENIKIFNYFLSKKGTIENEFGNALIWEELKEKRACRISFLVQTGGYRDEEAIWSEIQEDLIDAMIRLEKAVRPHFSKLTLNEE